MTKDRKYKKEYAVELLRIARNDLIAARTLQANPEVRRETTFFQIQQAVEKSLKALLCHLEMPVPMVHDIRILIDRLGIDHTPPRAEDLVDLSDFAAVRRYEEGKFELTVEELVATIELATAVIEHCADKINH